MRNDSSDELFSPGRHEILAALGINGLALAALLVAGYFAPDLLAILFR